MQKDLRFKLLVAVMVLMVLSFTSCGGNGNGPDIPTLTDGWSRFEASEYTDAATTFREVLDRDPSLADGYNGLAWAYAVAGNLDSACAYFEITIERDSGLVSAHAGLSAVFKARGNLDGAIASALAVLNLDSLWEFTHVPTIDYEDIRLILAQAYFGQGGRSYPLAQDQVDRLEPDNGLDPDESGTWDGHPTYAAALLKKLQEIEERVGAEMMY